jgi:hypothetical protein
VAVRIIKPGDPRWLPLVDLLAGAEHWAPVEPDLIRTELRQTPLVLIAEEGGHLVGSIGLQPLMFPWSSGRFLTDRYFYVPPGGAGAADDLVRVARAIAEADGRRLVLSVTTGADEVKHRWMLRQGARELGRVYLFE